MGRWSSGYKLTYTKCMSWQRRCPYTAILEKTLAEIGLVKSAGLSKAEVGSSKGMHTSLCLCSSPLAHQSRPFSLKKKSSCSPKRKNRNTNNINAPVV